MIITGNLFFYFKGDINIKRLTIDLMLRKALAMTVISRKLLRHKVMANKAAKNARTIPRAPIKDWSFSGESFMPVPNPSGTETIRKKCVLGTFFSLQKHFSVLPCYHNKVNGFQMDRTRGGFKIMKKRVWMLTIAAAAVLALGGCSGSGDSQEAQSGAVETTAQAEESDSQETSGGSGETSGEAAQEEAESTGGTLIVGFDQEFPPMGFMAEDGSYVGFDLDLAQEAASRLGLEYQAQPIAWDSKDMELESGNIDCIWNGFTITGREDDYEWTEPYMDNAQVFVVNGDSGIETLDDLAGKVVECQADSSALAALNEDAELTATFAQLLTTADYNSALMDLEQGAVDAVAMDVIVARYQIQQREANFVVLDETLSSEAYAVGFKKGNTELRDQVQGALEEMAADGTMAEISEKWFGEDLTVIGK